MHHNCSVQITARFFASIYLPCVEICKTTLNLIHCTITVVDYCTEHGKDLLRSCTNAKLRWSLCQRAVREKSVQLIYTDVKICTYWWGSKVGPTRETFTKPGLLTAGCVTNRDLQALCLWIIHTRSALHISSDVCKREIVPGAQKLNWEFGEVFNRFLPGFPYVGRHGRLSPAPSWCSPRNVALKARQVTTRLQKWHLRFSGNLHLE